MGLEFRLLGPLEVLRDGTPIPIPAAMQRALLACLLSEPNAPVRVDVLADMLWATDPPRDVRTTLRGYVMRLRKVLDASGGPSRISTRNTGYSISVEEDELDLLRFRRLVDEARSAPSAEIAAPLWAAAVGLWRGEALADLPHEGLRRVLLPGMREQRLLAVERGLDARLAIGEHTELIPDLERLVAEHPLRERFWAQLMEALHRSSRRADALAAYRALAELLRHELGIEPSVELRELHGAILRGDPEPLRPKKVPPPVPAQLPADVRSFTGRAGPLGELDEVLGTDGTGAVAVLTGTAGVGKTALAVRWAHSARAKFPDGQLYLDLNGYGPQEPLPPAEALARLLRSLDAPVPDHEAERATSFRSIVDGRRLLLLLDNARGSEQVRPLLPGTASCQVLVTSRDNLAGLVARDGARRVPVDRFTTPEAVALLRELIGRPVEADPEAARALAARCAGLPLALRVAAEATSDHPVDDLAELTRTLDVALRRSAAQDRDEFARVHTVFSWSVARLEPTAARAFRLLGSHPGPDFDHWVIAAAADCESGAARAVADVLVRANLVERTGSRMRMHDLLREYAASLAGQDADETAAATARITAWFASGAAAAMDRIAPHEEEYRRGCAPEGTSVPDLPDHAAALRWLADERPNLLAVSAHAPLRFYRLLWRFLDNGGHHDDAIRLAERAVETAEASRDAHTHADALANLAISLVRARRSADATARAEQALAIAREAADPDAEVRALNSMGILHSSMGDYHAARECELRALEVAVAAGDHRAEYRTRANLASTYRTLNLPEEALLHATCALAAAEADGNHFSASRTRAVAANILQRLGRLDKATEHLATALRETAITGDRALRGYLLNSLGTVHTREGDHPRAALELRQALAIAEEIGDHGLRCAALVRLGRLSRLVGRPGDAVEHYSRALSTARQVGNRHGEADAHTGLALTVVDEDLARVHRQHALDLFAELRLPVDPELAARFDHSG